MRKTLILCDWSDAKGKPCEKDANVAVSLFVEGESYSCDLCPDHANALTANAAKKTAPPATHPRKGKVVGVPHGMVRVWANEHPELVESVMGKEYVMPPKGRLPQALIDAYVSAG